MSQLAEWRQGAEIVRVTTTDGGIVIAHKVTAESRARSLTLPRSRGLLLALREVCDQEIRKMGVAP